MENSLSYLILSCLAIRSKFVLFLALVFTQGKGRGLGLRWSYTLETGFKCLKYVSILTSFPLWLGIVTETKNLRSGQTCQRRLFSYLNFFTPLSSTEFYMNTRNSHLVK